MKKSLKILLFVLFGVLALYFSFYTESLTDKLQKEQIKDLNPEHLVDYHWKKQLDDLIQRALPFEEILQGLQNDALGYAGKNAKVLGIGSNFYFVLQAQAKIEAIDEQYLYLILSPDTKAAVPLMYVFSSLARDASGWFSPGDFRNTMDFNTVSSCLNKKILQEVIAPVKEQLKIGTRLQLVAAFEFNINAFPIKELVLIPYHIKILP